jgi:hypothetical protein
VAANRVQSTIPSTLAVKPAVPFTRRPGSAADFDDTRGHYPSARKEDLPFDIAKLAISQSTPRATSCVLASEITDPDLSLYNGQATIIGLLVSIDPPTRVKALPFLKTAKARSRKRQQPAEILVKNKLKATPRTGSYASCWSEGCSHCAMISISLTGVFAVLIASPFEPIPRFNHELGCASDSRSFSPISRFSTIVRRSAHNMSSQSGLLSSSDRATCYDGCIHHGKSIAANGDYRYFSF